MAELRLEHIYKIYDKNIQAVTDFNLHIHNKEFIVFVGPSGCGKTTTLRMIAGLEDISKGELYIDDVLMNDVESKDRSIAMVFQSYALYPHMTVYDNMAFSLKLRKVDKKEIDHRVKEAAKILGLEDYLKRKPKALSGGQRQRVALGRAIVRDAKVFLMDEPLSNLDAKLRVQMRAEIQKLHQRIQTTTIYVTHDQTEAMTMATRLVVMKDGLIQQIGTPKEVYNTPHNMFVAGFIGSPSMNLFHCHLTETEILLGEQSFPIPSMYVPLLKEKNYLGKEIVMGIRPEDLQITDVVSPFAFKATIDVTELLGAETYLYCSLNNQNFIARVQADNNLHPSDRVSFVMREEKIHFFDPETEERL
ncbi:MAG TPA: sn-glycerol-3-phosphate ABC transporter ATP-binding protein UgpC [Lysinibacillus sp.]|uniref:ABC transporter ATP-binding protein n=1 Tax=unclassified Lysinibacillus TaxID=2636778 RepID=UPI000881C173|nr:MULTISPECIES: sn-glycerol-3-phosphate ABC transporter ATP-binding protein UgpC [unclassified Lysinibacillus]HBT71351.1 sn-glycerol-3-phosphate ABC transporter ATP-binding protein UgpC [Lysinibacillus sp.]WCH48082.1 sn-glycerol-3-phosphate ABC transporter ATP-binding protein UgpC [Lysinibacillus sp. OF-1]SCZ11562.1 carbohydrate ABC transporter ATP-binding protein, CUT1 family (TC 3.A.1.1.-) [Lysinibacillus sp. SG9]SDB56536.1 carbohydrate ABC transporter ATP-binding protein, CUT1 family (TC 3.